MFDGNSPYSAFRTDCWGYCTTLHDEDASFKFGIKKRLTSGPPSPREARITLLALIWSRPLLIIERNNIRNGGPTGRDMNKTESEATHAAFSAPQEAQHSHREGTHHVPYTRTNAKVLLGSSPIQMLAGVPLTLFTGAVCERHSLTFWWVTDW